MIEDLQLLKKINLQLAIYLHKLQTTLHKKRTTKKHSKVDFWFSLSPRVQMMYFIIRPNTGIG